MCLITHKGKNHNINLKTLMEILKKQFIFKLSNYFILIYLYNTLLFQLILKAKAPPIIDIEQGLRTDYSVFTYGPKKMLSHL